MNEPQITINRPKLGEIAPGIERVAVYGGEASFSAAGEVDRSDWLPEGFLTFERSEPVAPTRWFVCEAIRGVMFGAPQFGDESYFEATADEAQEWINKWDAERLSERAAMFAKRADDDAREAKEELERVQAARHRLATRLAELTGSTPEQSKEILELLEGIQ